THSAASEPPTPQRTPAPLLSPSTGRFATPVSDLMGRMPDSSTARRRTKARWRHLLVHLPEGCPAAALRKRAPPSTPGLPYRAEAAAGEPGAGPADRCRHDRRVATAANRVSLIRWHSERSRALDLG